MTDSTDRLTFFLLVAEEIESLRKRIGKKLDPLPAVDRREWTDRNFSRMVYHLREAQLAALKMSGSEFKRAAREFVVEQQSGKAAS